MIDLDTLNGPQREAVLCTEGPLLVLAGAGSGKTRVLTYRIAHMLEDLGIQPWQILAITFTNKAAAEMRERLGRLVGPAARGMWVSTFHSMCVRILRADAERIGFDRNFTIYDDAAAVPLCLLRAATSARESRRLLPLPGSGRTSGRLTSKGNEKKLIITDKRNIIYRSSDKWQAKE